MLWEVKITVTLEKIVTGSGLEQVLGCCQCFISWPGCWLCGYFLLMKLTYRCVQLCISVCKLYFSNSYFLKIKSRPYIFIGFTPGTIGVFTVKPGSDRRESNFFFWNIPKAFSITKAYSPAGKTWLLLNSSSL